MYHRYVFIWCVLYLFMHYTVTTPVTDFESFFYECFLFILSFIMYNRVNMLLFCTSKHNTQQKHIYNPNINLWCHTETPSQLYWKILIIMGLLWDALKTGSAADSSWCLGARGSRRGPITSMLIRKQSDLTIKPIHPLRHFFLYKE